MRADRELHRVDGVGTYACGNETRLDRRKNPAPAAGLWPGRADDPTDGFVFDTVAEHFPTLLNLRSIVSDKAIIALLSLAAMIPMVAGKIDLTVGYGIVLWHVLAISLH